jgi:hypothetical protein
LSASQKIGSRLIEVAWPAIITDRLMGPISEAAEKRDGFASR